MPISAVSGGYAGGDELWFMTPAGTVITAMMGEELTWPYFYSDTELRGGGIIEQKLETIRILKLDEIQERRMYKVEMESPSLTKGLRGHAKVTAEDDIVYLERRLGGDGVVEWVPPKRISYMDIESSRDTGKMEIIGSVLDGKYEVFRDAQSYFEAMEAEKVAAVTAWNGNHYDFRILDAIGGSAHWNRMQHIDSMDLYANFSIRKSRRGLDVVARREKVGQKLDESAVGQLAYNENDCRIMEGIINKLDLIGTEFELCAQTGLYPSTDNLRAIAKFENFLIRHRDKYHLWLSGKHAFKQPEGRIEGALIMYGEPGIYDGVGMLDYTSLYPSIAINCDYHGAGETVWSVLKQLQTDWVGLKEEAGRNKQKSRREAFKILANGSGYGIFQNEFFRYYCKELAAFITSTARDKLLELRLAAEDMGFRPLMSDTDSCAVLVSKAKKEALLRVVNHRIAPFSVKEEYYLSRFILFAGLEGKAVKKRYAALVDGGDELVVKGLEMVRNDWSPWARDMQERLLRIMLTVPVEDVERKLVDAIMVEKTALFGGKIPIDDVAITKSIDTEKKYKVLTQHMKAFNQMHDKGQGVIGFVTYWLDKKEQPFVRNKLTDAEVMVRLDWGRIWRKQAEPIVKRLKSCFPSRVKTLELYLEKEE